MSTPEHGAYLTGDQVEALAVDMTVADVWQAQLAHPGDNKAQGMASLHLAALRLGTVPEGTELLPFLGRIRLADFERAMADRAPKVPTAPPPLSVVSGE